jgi:hypothetical protein
MSAEIIDLWATAKDDGRARFDDDYYITNYNINLHVLYIKESFAKEKKYYKSIVQAIPNANDNTRKLRIKYYNTRYSMDTDITIHTKDGLDTFLKKLKNTKDVYISNPGEYDDDNGEVLKHPRTIGIMEGGNNYKKSAIKKHILGRERVIYLGKYNKHYIKRNGRFVPVNP